MNGRKKEMFLMQKRILFKEEEIPLTGEDFLRHWECFPVARLRGI